MSQLLRIRPSDGTVSSAALRARSAASGAWACIAFVFVAITVCVAPPLIERTANARPGERWTGPEVRSPVTLHMRDTAAEEEARRYLEFHHQRVFRTVPDSVRYIEDTGRRVEDTIRSVSSSTTESAESQAQRLRDTLRAQLGIPLALNECRALLEAGPVRINQLIPVILHLVFANRGVTADHVLLAAARQDQAVITLDATGRLTSSTASSLLGWPRETIQFTEQEVLPQLQVEGDLRDAIVSLVRVIGRPTVVFDPEETANRLRETMERVRVDYTIERGAIVVTTGDVVSLRAAEAMANLRVWLQRNNLQRAAGAALAVILTMAFLALYIKRHGLDLPFESRSVLLVALPVVMAISIGRVGVNLMGESIGSLAFPAGMVGMVGTLLFDARFALMLVTAASLLFGVSNGLAYPQLMVALVGGYTGAAALSQVTERRQVLVAGCLVALANIAGIVTVTLATDPSRLATLQWAGGLTNGIACYGLTVMALPFFESVFRVASDWRLLELTTGRHPLLRELEDHAPGTFEHSLNVAKLGEAAAEVIGANALLVRAGSWFHDIGKMLKPQYFTENQNTPEEKRIHSKLSPAMSALIIKDHVRQGLELARRHQLPDRIVDFIAQHHGTSLIRYFHAKEQKRMGDTTDVPEDEFRYPGPKPQTIETGIVMIADSVDAIAVAKLSGKSVDEDDLRKLVRDTIREKFEDGQFDECALTLQDLHRIQEAFVRSLRSRFHTRIDYPSAPAKDHDPSKELQLAPPAPAAIIGSTSITTQPAVLPPSSDAFAN